MTLHPQCAALWARGEKVLAGGPGTFSKHATRQPQGLAPFALVSGEGPYVLGSNGQTYLDTIAGLGAVLLGYGHPAVTEASTAQAEHGCSFSLLHPLEIEVAEQLCALLPCAEMCRFMRNGTDSTNAAIRLARAITQKQHVLFAGYFGGAMDSYGITTDKQAGILPHIAAYNHQLAWGDPDALATALDASQDDLAAIIVEVHPRPWGQDDTAAMLTHYQATAHDHGALFILDEIVSFPRYGLHGAQQLYGVTPDLSCVSKGVANGLPLAALVGKRQYMERFNQGDIFTSYTFAGETTALAAAKATLEVCQTTDALTQLWRMGYVYGETLCEILATHGVPAHVWGNPARMQVRWQDVPGSATAAELRTLWLAEHARRGILIGIGALFPMTCWGEEEVARLAQVGDEVAALIAAALAADRVQDALPCPVITDVLAVR